MLRHNLEMVLFLINHAPASSFTFTVNSRTCMFFGPHILPVLLKSSLLSLLKQLDYYEVYRLLNLPTRRGQLVDSFLPPRVLNPLSDLTARGCLVSSYRKGTQPVHFPSVQRRLAFETTPPLLRLTLYDQKALSDTVRDSRHIGRTEKLQTVGGLGIISPVGS